LSGVVIGALFGAIAAVALDLAGAQHVARSRMQAWLSPS
jgi:hypothetical protein